MSNHLGLLFDPDKTKFDQELLTQQFCTSGLNFLIYFKDTLILSDKNVNISFGCSLAFILDESWQRKGFYLDVFLSDSLSGESLEFIFSNFIIISKEMGFRILFNYVYEINETNYRNFPFEAVNHDSPQINNPVKFDKSYYLGSVDPSKTPPKKQLDVTQLLILENERSVVNICCAYCNTVLEGAQQNADALCRAANIPLRTDFKGKYFLTSYCFVCDAKIGELTVELKNISDLIN